MPPKINLKSILTISCIILLIICSVMSVITNIRLTTLSKRLSHLTKFTKHTTDTVVGYLTAEEVSSHLKVQLVDLLKIYSVSDDNGPLKFIRLGKEYDGGYVVPEKALVEADVLMGYGISDDPSFENDFSIKYNKPSYGFDCGVPSAKAQSKLFTFKSECIANDSFVYNNQKSSMKVSSFSEQLNSLGINNKKVFVKMDIEGSEYDAFDDILKHSNNITGIALEIHFDTAKAMDRAISLLSKLKGDFVLVHVHGTNCSPIAFKTENSTGLIPYFIELTYINKNLVNKSFISDDQTHPTHLDMPCNPEKRDYEFKVLVDHSDKITH